MFGAGASGLAAAALLEKTGWRAVVLEGAAVWPDDAGISLAVTSPGVPLSHPWHAAARRAGVPVESELQFAARHWKGRTLAVTGSKGKSSVVKLVADSLALSGRRAVACGNYGVPLSSVVLDTQDPAGVWAVVETSSFQMETTDAFHPEAAACLNLQDDHLDRHGTRERYHALKMKLLDLAGCRIGCDPALDPLLAGSYFDNPVLRPNGEIAAGLLLFAGLSPGEIRRGFEAFVPLAHRMQTVAVKDGVRYVDDSKATSLAALAAGVEMARASAPGGGVLLIAGGRAKGDNPESVISCLSNGVKKVYLIGECAEVFHSVWQKAVPCEMCGTLEAAADAAAHEAVAGDTVLLSPGTASFDQFKSYGARGDAFAAHVKEKQR